MTRKNPYRPTPPPTENPQEAWAGMDRMKAARNPNSHPNLLAELVRISTPKLWKVVARNPNTSPKTLAALATLDRKDDVREAVARNPHTPLSVLLVLTKDKQQAVRSEALKGLGTRPTSELVEAVKPIFPEATPDMPREWLIDLLSIPTE